MSEQYKGYEPQPERPPVFTIADLADAVERRRAQNKLDKRFERPERTVELVMEEMHVPNSDRLETSLRVREVLSERTMASLPQRAQRGVHPRGWLGELEDRQP